MMTSSIRMSVIGGVVSLISDEESERFAGRGVCHEVQVTLVHYLYQVSVNVLVVQHKVPPAQVVSGER